jgi:spermidine synthase
VKRVTLAMFGVGAVAVLVQVTMLRELLVVFCGNELSVGLIMGGWLLGVGLGALGARGLRRDGRFAGWTRHLLTMVPLALAGLLPLQVWWVRSVRLWLAVGAGDTVPFGPMLLTVLCVCLPSCVGIGLFFPLACEWGVKDRRRVDRDVAGMVSRIYTVEALGSMLGGVVFTFVLLPRLGPVQVMMVTAVVGVLAAACVAPWRMVRLGLLVVALVVAGLGAMPSRVAGVERAFVERRWAAFGVMGTTAAGRSRVRLAGSVDTVYQNLALIETEGHYALYGNGELRVVFPDVRGDELRVHPLMGMYPGAKRVLLLGGNVVGDIPELLKYGVEALVFVELDPGVVTLIRHVAPEAVAQALADERVTHVVSDGVRYVQQATGTFDVILVNAPEPSTAAANRYYTVEFFEGLKRLLAPDGIVITGVTASERLQDEASALGGMVYQALNVVFPIVKATAQTRTVLFAGARRILPDGTPRITFDRETLYARSRAAGVETTYFRPEWFLGAAEMDAAKSDLAERRLRDVAVAENRVTRPAACLATLKLWSRFSGSGIERLLAAVERVDVGWVKRGVWATGLVALLLGAVVRRCGGVRARDVWLRALMGVVLASIGFLSMAMNLLLVMAFQGVYGTVYARIGLIVAVFMLGLVVGAPSGLMVCRWRVGWRWAGLLSILIVLLLAAAAVPRVMLLVYRFMGHATLGRLLEGAFYLMIAGLGLLTGAAFPLANRLYADAGGSLGVASAVTDASDHLGAALGALLVGVVLLPVLGVDGVCSLLVALMAAALMVVLSAALVRR